MSSTTSNGGSSLSSTLASLLPSFVHSNSMALALSATSLGVLTLVAYAVREKKRNRDCRPIPLTCPEKCHFIKGHSSVFSKNRLDGLKEILIDGADEDGLSCFYLYSYLMFGVTKVEHLKEIFQAFSHRIPNSAHDRHVLKLLGNKSVLLQTGNEWKTNRHIISKAFRWEYLQDMMPTICETGLLLAEVLDQHAGQCVDVFTFMKAATIDAVGATAFGYHFGSLDAMLNENSGRSHQSGGRNLGVELTEAFTFMSEELRRRQYDEPLNPFAQMYWLPSAANIKYRRAKNLWMDTLKGIIEARREAVKAGDRSFNDMLNQLLDARDDETNQVMDDEALMDNLVTLLFAGYDTSSIALSYLVYATAKYPEVDKKCIDEITRVLGNDGLPSYQEVMNNLPYCNAVMQETLRLFPSAPTTYRTLPKDFTLSPETTSKPVTFPAGCRIIIPIWYINRSPRNYSNPEEFMPERFLPENAGKVNRYANIPFSAGVRDCVGRRFATMDILTLFVIMLRRIRFRLKDPNYVPKPVTIGLVQVPKDGMPLILERRE
jgi:cytochrome P450